MVSRVPRVTYITGKKSKKTGTKSAKAIDKSRTEAKIEKRENENLNYDVGQLDYVKTEPSVNREEHVGKSSGQRRSENVVPLPFVQIGKAQVRIRIEKISTSESARSNSWTDRSPTTGPFSTALPKEIIDEIANTSVTNPEFIPSLDSIGAKGGDNLTVEITLKKFENGVPPGRKGCDSDKTMLHNVELRPTKSTLSDVKDERNSENGEYDRSNRAFAESADEDAKSRAKRNQLVASRRYLRSDARAMGFKRFEDAGESSIRYDERGRTRYARIRSSRAARSVEEIKELAEKLISKVNHLY